MGMPDGAFFRWTRFPLEKLDLEPDRLIALRLLIVCDLLFRPHMRGTPMVSVRPIEDKGFIGLGSQKEGRPKAAF